MMPLRPRLRNLIAEDVDEMATQFFRTVPLELSLSSWLEDLPQHGAEVASGSCAAQLAVVLLGDCVVYQHELVIFLLFEVGQADGKSILKKPSGNDSQGSIMTSRRSRLIAFRHLSANVIRQALAVRQSVVAHNVDDGCLLFTGRMRFRLRLAFRRQALCRRGQRHGEDHCRQVRQHIFRILARAPL